MMMVQLQVLFQNRDVLVGLGPVTGPGPTDPPKSILNLYCHPDGEARTYV